MKRITIFLLAFFICFISPVDITAQVATMNEKEIPLIKEGTTFIIMNDLNDSETEIYREIFKKYWEYNNVDFIKYEDINKNISPENAFFTFSGHETTVTSSSGMSYSNPHVYIKMWKPTEKFFKKKERKERKGKDLELTSADIISLARIELYTDNNTLHNPELLLEKGYKSEGRIKNWGPGVLKNYIQLLNEFLKKEEERSLYESFSKKEELRKLKQEVLYIPEYVVGNVERSEATGEPLVVDQKLLDDYEYEYKVISIEDLNKKILLDNTAFYYFIYIHSSTDKFISVINSQNGEMIYSDYTPITYNVKSKDFKKLNKKIK